MNRPIGVRLSAKPLPFAARATQHWIRVRDQAAPNKALHAIGDSRPACLAQTHACKEVAQSHSPSYGFHLGTPVWRNWQTR